MPWIIKDLIFKPEGKFDWSQTHAQVPTAIELDHAVRIFYATRDKKGRSLTSFIDVAKDNPSNILSIHNHPILDLGQPGTHDEDGVMSGCVVRNKDRLYAYYTGWSRCQTVPYHVSVGLAESIDDGRTFKRVFEGPVVDRTPLEPYMTMSPYVLCEDGIWKMWYGSGTRWVEIDGTMEPIYQIKYAESRDGLGWQQDNIICINQTHALEANTRPSVMKTADGYEMWFSYRHSIGFREASGGYRIGYATSKDGKVWTRHEDPQGLAVSEDGWTKNMIAYPNVIMLKGKKTMFFNGDGFGRSGFGYAVWEE